MDNLFGNYFDSAYTTYTNSTKWFEFSKPFGWYYKNGEIIKKDIINCEPEQELTPTPELMDYLEQYKQQ